MFANRRKRLETNKATYIHHLVHSKGANTEATQENNLWKSDKTNIYCANEGGVAIGKETPPLSALDVSGGVNASTTYTINYVNIAPPVGSIMAYTVANSPDGWLICDGREVCRKKYAGLFEVVGTTFGHGDGTHTFHLPNYQGAFLRGTGSNGIYSGPGLNLPQSHATQKHSHPASTTITDTGHVHTQSHSHYAAVNDPGHIHTLTTYNDDINMSGSTRVPSLGTFDAPTNAYNTIVNSSSTGISVSISTNNTPVNSATTGISATTTVNNSTLNTDPNETRPYNYGVYWIIKY